MANYNKNKQFSLSQFIDKVIERQSKDIHTALPGKVVSYSISNGYLMADIQPLIKDEEDNIYEDFPTIPSVLVQMPAGLGGDAFINVPLSIGDNGLLIFCETGIDTWMNSNGSETVEPSQIIRHSLSNAVFMPGLTPTKVTYNNLSEDNIVINNDSGGVSVHSNGDVEVTDLATGKYIKLGNSPTDNPVNYSGLDTALSTLLALIDTQLTALGQPGGIAASWNSTKAATKTNKIKIPDSTET
jgi:hypothetical protein